MMSERIPCRKNETQLIPEALILSHCQNARQTLEIESKGNARPYNNTMGVYGPQKRCASFVITVLEPI